MKITPNYLSSMKGFFMKKGKKSPLPIISPAVLLEL